MLSSKMTRNRSGNAERDPTPSKPEPEKDSRFPKIQRYGDSRPPRCTGEMNMFGFQAVANACRQAVASPKGRARRGVPKGAAPFTVAGSVLRRAAWRSPLSEFVMLPFRSKIIELNRGWGTL